jgi:hypothetical protein
MTCFVRPVPPSFSNQGFGLILAMPTIGEEAVLGRDASILSGIERPLYNIVAFHCVSSSLLFFPSTISGQSLETHKPAVYSFNDASPRAGCEGGSFAFGLNKFNHEASSCIGIIAG